MDVKDLPQNKNNRKKVTYEAKNGKIAGDYQIKTHKGTVGVYFNNAAKLTL